MLILLIEDDADLTRMVKRGLTVQGHRVLTTETGDEGLLLLASAPIDLVLLDIQLPGLDGLQTLAAIRRRRRDLPVIMLTARDDLASKVSALDGGADDYITKPFAYEELLARIRALTRRADPSLAATQVVSDLRIDRSAHTVWRGGRDVELTRREFALLEYFVRNQRRLLSRQQILAAVWEFDFEGESNVVDVYVRHLRQKLDRDGEPSLFTTIRGIGYRFDPPPPRAP